MGEPEQSGGDRKQFRVCNLEELQFPDSSINILHDTEFLETLVHFNLVVGASFIHNLGLFTTCERQKGEEVLRVKISKEVTFTTKQLLKVLHETYV
jgi:hypothetical protein